MKIALFYKSYTLKALSSLALILSLASFPSLAQASFFDFITGAEANDNVPSLPENSQNSQNMPLLETSVNPDLKNSLETDSGIIVQNDFIYSDGLTIPDVKFEKSTLSDKINVYTVAPGDTLSEIAEAFDVSTNTIRWENDISGQTIAVGDKLNILPVTGVKHIVKSGDTVSKIADKYEAETEDILIFNDIATGVGLKKGDIIFVPNGIIKPVVVKTKPTTSHTTPNISSTPVTSGYYMRPAAGIVTSPYGSRKGGFHPGVDIGNVRGTPIVAAASGVVVQVISGCKEGARSCGGRYGNHIVIEHPNGTKTRYAHLSKTSVSVGQEVSQGQKIGALGNTGSSTGPHLHFEIEKENGSKMRPSVY